MRESQKLLSYGFRYFETQKLYEAGIPLRTVDVWYGADDTVELGVAEDVFITIPRGTYEQIEAELEVPRVIEAPLAAGEGLGELRLALHGESILNVPLISLDTVEEAGLFTRLWHAVYLAFSDLLNSE